MGDRVGMRFHVHPEQEEAARAHFEERGFRPLRTEQADEGLVVLVFSRLPEPEMRRLVSAVPVHLSAKFGIVVGNRPPFSTDEPDVY
jgi:hypothetical protein